MNGSDANVSFTGDVIRTTFSEIFNENSEREENTSFTRSFAILFLLGG